MPIHVTLSTTLRARAPGYDPAAGLTLDWPGPGPAGDLADRLGLPRAEIKIVMLNGRRAGLEAEVRDGDRVSFFPAVGGG